nr:MAG TPA: hypothetical protein [Caudoviricetes sp.]
MRWKRNGKRSINNLFLYKVIAWKQKDRTAYQGCNSPGGPLACKPQVPGPQGKGEEEKIMGKLALLNTSILTTAGAYRLIDITLDDARRIVSDHAGNLDSAIGHQSTAEIMTTLLGTKIPVNRQMFTQEVGQAALVFKLNGRPQEGKILSAEEIAEIGYKFQILKRLE